MGRQHRNRDERIHASQARGERKQIQCFSEPASVFATAIHFEAEHATAAAHLLHRKRALPMSLKERVMHPPYFRVTREKLRDAQRVVVLPLHSYGKRLDAAQQQPGSMWIHISAKRGAGFANLVNQIAAAGNYASN